MTICINCVHHRGDRASDIWYDHHCAAPAVQELESIDPATGRRVEPELPNCRDINTGECPHFEAASVSLGIGRRLFGRAGK